MRENKFSFRQLKLFAFALSGIALLFFILACTTNDGTCIFFGVMAALSLVFGCVCLYLAHRIAAKHTNFFLFDRRRGTMLTPETLTFSFINDNLTYFLSPYVDKSIDLWNGIPKNLEMALEAAPAYRAPVALRMLHDMSLLDGEAIEALFLSADKKTVAALCRTVKAAGDKEMADIIFELKCDFERLRARIIPFFKKNKRFFEGKMYHYIKEHIEEFDTAKK